MRFAKLNYSCNSVHIIENILHPAPPSTLTARVALSLKYRSLGSEELPISVTRVRWGIQ